MIIRILLLSALVSVHTAQAALTSWQTPHSLTNSPLTPRKTAARRSQSWDNLSTIQESVIGSNNDSHIPSDNILEAAFDNDIVQVTRLLKTGINPNTKNSKGLTALHIAEYALMTELLLTRGAHANIPDNKGNTPLHYAGNNHQVEALVKKGALCTKNNDGNTPLHLVGDIKNGNQVVSLLLQAKAKLTDTNKKNRTPLEQTVIIFVAKLKATDLPDTETTSEEILATIQALIAQTAPINRTKKESTAALALLLKKTKSLVLTKKQKKLLDKAKKILRTPIQDVFHQFLARKKSTSV